MKITITMQTGNEAFKTQWDVANALRALADRIDNGLDRVSKVMDENGNAVGTVETEE